jgi:hypothetical protein
MRLAPSAIAEMVLSFFSGLCIERKLKSGKASSIRKIENFMTALRSLKSNVYFSLPISTRDVVITKSNLVGSCVRRKAINI